MSTFIHGVSSAQCLDKSGEIVDIKGLDITSLPITGVINYEHKNDTPNQICGKILTSKKIFNQADCSNNNEMYFWNKTKVPFVYITAELLDDYCQSGKDAAGLFRYAKDNPHQKGILGFSVEGSELPNTRSGATITRSIARKVTLTAAPCNSACVAEILEPQESHVRDEFEEIFKSQDNAIEMFKTEKGSKMYQEYLAKSLTSKSKSFGSKPRDLGKEVGKTTTGKSVLHNQIVGNYGFNSKEHKEASQIHLDAAKQAMAMKNGALANHHVEKAKLHGQAAGTEERKEGRLQTALKQHSAKMATRKSANSSNLQKACPKHKKSIKKVDMSTPPPEPNQANAQAMQAGAMSGPTSFSDAMSNIKTGLGFGKALEAGNANAAPSTLINGAAYQTEGFAKPKKKDWNKRAKQDYETWQDREKFEKFMKARMPHLKDGEIAAIGRVLCLKKTLEFERSLDSLIKGSEEQKYHIHVDGKAITEKPLTIKEIKAHTGKFPHELEANPNTKVIPHKGI